MGRKQLTSGEQGFVHLHNHTQYSVIDGHGKIVDYVQAAKADGQTALAITDHGNVAGAIEFYLECRKHGIKPIIGSELYVDIVLREKQIPYHMTVLAADLQGYRDLVEVSTRAHKNFYYRSRITLKEIIDAGLMKHWVVLTGCPSSAFNFALREGRTEDARELLHALKQASKDTLIEIMYHKTDDNEFRQMQSDLLHAQIDFAIDLDFPMVLTNDCHYVSPEDERIHQEFLKATEGRVHGIEFDGEGFHLKTSAQMREVADYLGQEPAYDNASYVADICDLEIPEADKPTWYVPSPFPDPEEEISKRCNAVLQGMVGTGVLVEDYGNRYLEEMAVIRTSEPIMNSYLVAADLIDFCKNAGIPATGRGSMAGSLVSYLLGITSEDPVKFNLNFKRAVNPARLTIPDFDIDVSSRRRDEVLAYIAGKYPHSAPIGSYSERGIKGATRWVMRSLNYTAEYTNQVAKELPENGEIDLEPIPEKAREVVRGYLGLYGNQTVHPAGVLVSGEERPLQGIIPMCYIASSKTMVTQFDMYTLKKIDFFKLDILGLSTLDVLDTMEQLSGQKPPTEYDDEQVFKTLSDGLVCEIFQLDGYAARATIKALGISNFEDIVAINALVRPGASQFIPSYRSGDSTLIDEYPPLNDVLSVTRGLILYQEQVMEISRVLAGFDDLQQDDIKEAIKYFRAEVFAEMEPVFMDGCKNNGHDGTLIFNAIKAFAGYAFNRAHAVTYAATAYKMAWYKTHFPDAFYTAVYDRSDNKVRAILESLRLGVEWITPDINLSEANTSFRDGKVILGLTTIKGVGPAVAEEIVRARREVGKFTSPEHFEKSIKKQKCNAKHRQILMDACAYRTLGIDGDVMRYDELLGYNRSVTDTALADTISVYEQERLGGYITNIRPRTVRPGSKNSGKEMCFVTLTNKYGEFEATVFPEDWKRLKKALADKPAMLPVIFNGQTTEKGFSVYNGQFFD